MEIVFGQRVTWVSQARGIARRKVGEVVAIAPARMAGWRVFDEALRLGLTVSSSMNNVGSARDHESYLVRVGARAYWPRVSALMPAHGLLDGSTPMGSVGS